LIQQFSRRALGALLVGAVSGCSNSGPSKADAVEQIRQKLRQTIVVGQEQIDNLTYRDGKDLGDGRYVVMVDYDHVSLVPTIGLFNTVNGRGSRDHIERERYVFVQSGKGWVLE